MNFIKYLLILLTLFYSIFFSYHLLEFYIEQDTVLKDFNLKQKNFEYESFDDDFFEYGATAMHNRSVKARYLANDSRYSEALKVLNEKEYYDPLHMDDLYKSISYYYLQNQDSFNKYAEKAHMYTPKIASHYIWYLKSLSDQRKPDKILESYLKIKDEKDLDELSHAYFFMTALNFNEQLGDTLKILANEIINIKNYEIGGQLDVSLDYVIFGQQNVKLANEISSEAMDLVNMKKYDEAHKKFIYAYSLYPKKIEIFENAINCLNELAEYERIISLFEEDIEKYILSDKIKFLVGFAYFKTNNSKVCDILSLEDINENKAFTFLKEFCNQK